MLQLYRVSLEYFQDHNKNSLQEALRGSQRRLQSIMVQSIIKYSVIAVIALISLIGGYRYISSLQRQIAELKTVVTVQQGTIDKMDQNLQRYIEVHKLLQNNISTVDIKYKNAKEELNNVFKETTGNNRIINDRVINSLCSAYDGKYCSKQLYTPRAD